MKKFMVAVLAFFLQNAVSSAGNYDLILPNPPGSSTDIVARALADEMRKRYQIELIIHYMPGGDHVIAAQKFVSYKKPVISLGTTTMHVFNPVYKKQLLYNDSNFDHVVWIGQSPHVWLVRTHSKIQHIRDIFPVDGGKKTTVGVDALSTQVNVLSVQKDHPQGNDLIMIPYKGSPQSVTDLLGGHIDVAVASVSNLIIEQILAGNLRALGTTNARDHSVGPQFAEAASRELKVRQFNGGFLISVKPNHDMTDVKHKILDAVRSESFQEKIRAINIIPDLLIGPEVNDFLVTYRKQVNELK